MSRASEYANGLHHIFKGFGFLAKRPRLWPFALLPTLVNLIILALMLLFFIHYYSDLERWISAHIGRAHLAQANTWYLQIAAAFLWVANLFLKLLVILVSLLIILILSYGLGQIAASPFNDILSERTEVMVTGIPSPPFSFGKFFPDLLRIVAIESVKAAILILIPVLLFVLNTLPVIGGFLYVMTTFIFGAWSLGFSYADLPFSRRVTPLSERIRFARRNKWSLIGFGSAFFIPFFTLLFAAPMVVGGTLLTLDIAAKGKNI